MASIFSRCETRLLTAGTVMLIACQNQNNDYQEGLMITKERNELTEKEKWNVEALYPDFSAWHREFEAVQGNRDHLRWPELADFKGKLKDPSVCKEMLVIYFSLQRKLSKLHTYAHLRYDEDLAHDEHKSGYGLITGVYYDFQYETSWIEPELLGMSHEEFTDLLHDPSLQEYRFFLEKIGRGRPHTRTPEIEAVLASAEKALESSHKAFGALNDADLTFEDAIRSDGTREALTKASYARLMKDRDAQLRRSTFANLHQAYQVHSNTFCELLQGQIQTHVFLAKSRNFSSCLEAALFPHQVEPVVYEQLISAVRAHLPALHEYVSFRKELLGLKEIYYSDLMVPLVEESLVMDYQAACQEVIASVTPLGPEYQKDLKNGLLQEGWVDVYETPRKRSGAYSSGCYDSMPYILLNYQGTLNDVLTLAHEAGHSMHSLLSRRHQKYPYAQYPIFVAEVASTFNEQLLLCHLKKKVATNQQKAYLINYELEGIRGTIFRQTLFAEFELQLHRWVEEGIPLTPTLISDFYVKLTKEYYGDQLTLDPGVSIEWARVPHFYYNFYVYQYATGLSAALDLFSQVMAYPESLEKYLRFLSSGGSQYPLNLLQNAGVDMRSSQAVDTALVRFKSLLTELRECL